MSWCKIGNVLVTEMIVDLTDNRSDIICDTSELADEGFVTFDQASEEKVLVMVMVLCHLGDSPMHAEVTNTMNPANSLTPCRMCNLRVDESKDKRTAKYVGEFVGVTPDGHPVSLIDLFDDLFKVL